MAKYNVKFSCGHEETKELFGCERERRAKIEYWEKSGKCTACYEKEKYADHDEIEMPYSEYKNNYSNCKTKANSYNKASKTIIVYVPKTPAESKPDTDSIEGRKEAIKKVADETGYPYDKLVNDLLNGTADGFRAQVEKYADIFKSNPDKSGKYATAYDAAIALYNVAKKYGL